MLGLQLINTKVGHKAQSVTLLKLGLMSLNASFLDEVAGKWKDADVVGPVCIDRVESLVWSSCRLSSICCLSTHFRSCPACWPQLVAGLHLQAGSQSTEVFRDVPQLKGRTHPKHFFSRLLLSFPHPSLVGFFFLSLWIWGKSFWFLAIFALWSGLQPKTIKPHVLLQIRLFATFPGK